MGSTTNILKFATTSPAREFIIGTEQHIIHQMQKAAPDKLFMPLPGADGSCSCSNCPFMAKNTLEKSIWRWSTMLRASSCRRICD